MILYLEKGINWNHYLLMDGSEVKAWFRLHKHSDDMPNFTLQPTIARIEFVEDCDRIIYAVQINGRQYRISNPDFLTSYYLPTVPVF